MTRGQDESRDGKGRSSQTRPEHLVSASERYVAKAMHVRIEERRGLLVLLENRQFAGTNPGNSGNSSDVNNGGSGNGGGGNMKLIIVRFVLLRLGDI